MLLQLDDIPRMHNIFASFFTWVLLAGYVVFPATFTSINKNDKLDQKVEGKEFEEKVLEQVRNAPLLYIAAACCLVGVAGMLWLWWLHAKNYVSADRVANTELSADGYRSGW